MKQTPCISDPNGARLRFDCLHITPRRFMDFHAKADSRRAIKRTIPHKVHPLKCQV